MHGVANCQDRAIAFDSFYNRCTVPFDDSIHYNQIDSLADCNFSLQFNSSESSSNFFKSLTNKPEGINSRIIDITLVIDSSFRKVPSVIKHLKMLRRLELYGEFKTNTLPKRIRKCKLLQNIQLSGNGTTNEIPKNIVRIKELENLAIGFNQINSTNINSILFLFNCKKLKSVQLFESDFNKSDIEYLKQEFTKRNIEIAFY